jgi:hypothetical protein
VRVPKMGRSAYWNGTLDSLSSNALGDANRGAFLALHSAVSTRKRLAATDPPERRAFSCFYGQSEEPFPAESGEWLEPVPGVQS